tara:strand:- start:322 stop:1056 length:735 start_codon:yes stop_codon:yes gene_type:complete
MLWTKVICGYLTPFDTINMCCTCKHLYAEIDEHMLKTNSTKDFKLLKKNGEHIENEKYVMGIGQVLLFLNNCNMINIKKKIKNVEVILSSTILVENSMIVFEDCIFIPENGYSLLDINKQSNVLFSYCYVKDFVMFCKTYDSETNFENTIFENVSVPILGRRTYSNIFDSKFISCNMPINYFENFRLVVRNTLFLKSVHSIIIHTDKQRNYLEIGDCNFSNCILPQISISNENTIDIFCNKISI